MKNLKKVLALALAMVMMFGMMTVAFAADGDKMTSKDLKDMDTVTNKAEVALLVDLEVISGFEDGTFRPTEAVTRAQMAKMVYYILTGDADADVYKGNSKFKDVTGHWAEGEINYLATAGIDVVAGDDLGNFNPNATVRVAEAAKMLLVAAGWDSEDRSYEGSGWSGSIMRDANKYGLMAGVNQTALQPMTRDNAAKMIFNGLNLGMVEAVRKQTFVGTGVEKLVDSYVGMDTTLGYNAYGLEKVSGIVESIDDDGNIVFAAATTPIDVKGTVKLPGDASMVGQNVEFYVKTTGATFTSGTNDAGKITQSTNGTFASLISAAPVAGGMKVLATLTGGVDWTKVYDEEDEDNYVADEVSGGAAYYVNGEKASRPANLDGGEVAELCDTVGDGEVTLVRVYKWQVATIGEKAAETKTDKNGKVTVTVDGITNLSNKDAAKVVGYQGLAAGDVVLYYADSQNKNWVIEKAESFTGDATARSKDQTKLTIGGKAYAESGIADSGVNGVFTGTLSDVKGYTFWLDKNGDICMAKAPEGAAVETKQAIVLSGGFKGGSEAGGLIGETGTADQANAQILFTDGTVEVVNVVKVGDNILNDEDNTLTKADMDALAGKLVDYSKNDKNEYTLTVASSTPIAADTAITAAIEFQSGVKANAATLFIVAKGNSKDGYTYTTYTGYKNIPAMTTSEAGLYVMDEDNAYATLVYLVATSFAGDAPAGYVYVTSTDYTETTESYVELDVVNADGVAETLKVDATLAANASKTQVGFTTIKTVDENGVVTEWGDAPTATATGVTTDLKLDKDTFTVNGNTYEYDSKTTVIVIELEGTEYKSVNVNTGAQTVSASAEDGVTLDIYLAGSPAAGDLVDLIYVIRTTAADAE